MDQTSFQFINYAPSSFQNDVNFQANNNSIPAHPKNLNKYELTENGSNCEFILSSNFWSYSEIKVLLSFLAENFDLYRKNKLQFYAKATINIGNNRTNSQVSSKIQTLKFRYEDEIKKGTGKARSKWPFLDRYVSLASIYREIFSM